MGQVSVNRYFSKIEVVLKVSDYFVKLRNYPPAKICFPISSQGLCGEVDFRCLRE
jgi:hypothetical protein